MQTRRKLKVLHSVLTGHIPPHPPPPRPSAPSKKSLYSDTFCQNAGHRDGRFFFPLDYESNDCVCERVFISYLQFSRLEPTSRCDALVFPGTLTHSELSHSGVDGTRLCGPDPLQSCSRSLGSPGSGGDHMFYCTVGTLKKKTQKNP